MRVRGLSSRTLGAAAPVAAGALLLSGCVTVRTDPATNLTASSATLKARVKGDGKPFTYWFQFGRFLPYAGETTHRSGGSSTTEQAVAENVTGLVSGATYHFRVCAGDSDGTRCGADATFNTGRLRPGFSESTVFSGLNAPTAVRFSRTAVSSSPRSRA